MMDGALKQRWVDALRDGAYTQGQGALRSLDDSGKEVFCCLGVLCDLIDTSGWHTPGTSAYNSYRMDDSSLAIGNPPYGVESIVGTGHCATLIRMNDGDGEQLPYSFAQIADYIEREVPTNG